MVLSPPGRPRRGTSAKSSFLRNTRSAPALPAQSDPAAGPVVLPRAMRAVQGEKDLLVAHRALSPPLGLSSRVIPPYRRQNYLGRSSPLIKRVKDLSRTPSPPARMMPQRLLRSLKFLISFLPSSGRTEPRMSVPLSGVTPPTSGAECRLGFFQSPPTAIWLVITSSVFAARPRFQARRAPKPSY